MENIISFMVEYWDDILLAITSIVTAASVIVKLTPTKKDDEVIGKIISLLNTLAINPKVKK